MKSLAYNGVVSRDFSREGHCWFPFYHYQIPTGIAAFYHIRQTWFTYFVELLLPHCSSKLTNWWLSGMLFGIMLPSRHCHSGLCPSGLSCIWDCFAFDIFSLSWLSCSGLCRSRLCRSGLSCIRDCFVFDIFSLSWLSRSGLCRSGHVRSGNCRCFRVQNDTQEREKSNEDRQCFGSGSRLDPDPEA